MTGRKSIFIYLTIKNEENPASPFTVKVQANKNHGICDVIVGTKVPQDIVKDGKKRTIMVFSPSYRETSVLSSMQGRQFNDPYVLEHLENILTETLNNHE